MSTRRNIWLLIRVGDGLMQVENFQPFYRFIPRYMDDLRIGAKILRDHLELEMEKEERAARAKANEKANAAAAAEKVKFTLLRLFSRQYRPQVKLAFIDDRRQKEIKDEMERQQRMSRVAGPSIPTSSRTPPSAPSTFSESTIITESSSQSEPQSDDPLLCSR